MKKLLCVFLLFWGGMVLLYAQEDSNASDEFVEINEYVTDIYFGNGIMTTYDEAKIEDEANTALHETLKLAILYEIYNGDKAKMNSYHNFRLAYNWSAKENFGDTAIAKNRYQVIVIVYL